MAAIWFGDTIEAIDGTVTALFAEGRRGVVLETPVNGRGLVRWGDDLILMGFHEENVRRVESCNHGLQYQIAALM